MAAEQENSEQASTLLGKHKRQVLAGAAVVLVSLGALWAYLMWGAVKPETVPSAYGARYCICFYPFIDITWTAS